MSAGTDAAGNCSIEDVVELLDPWIAPTSIGFVTRPTGLWFTATDF